MPIYKKSQTKGLSVYTSEKNVSSNIYNETVDNISDITVTFSYEIT